MSLSAMTLSCQHPVLVSVSIWHMLVICILLYDDILVPQMIHFFPSLLHCIKCNHYAPSCLSLKYERWPWLYISSLPYMWRINKPWLFIYSRKQRKQNSSQKVQIKTVEWKDEFWWCEKNYEKDKERWGKQINNSRKSIKSQGLNG